MINLRGLTTTYAARTLEHLLPLSTLYRILEKSLRSRAARLGFSNIPPRALLPAFFNQSGEVSLTTVSTTLHYHLNCQVELFPDRLSRPRWQERCRVINIEHVRKMVEEKRPLVLAFCHFGVYQLIGYWLRGLGIPATTVVTGESVNRSQLNRLKACWSPFPDLPTVFHQDKLSEMIKFLKSGKPVLVALDAPAGKQLDVPVRDGWTFQVAAGGLRLAARHGAELIFCWMIEEGPWQFRLEFGKPVPQELLTDKEDLIPAAKHMIDEWLVVAEKYPEQMSLKKLSCFKNSAQNLHQDEIPNPEKSAAR